MTDFGRILTAALAALVVVVALRPWAMGIGLGLETSWDVWAFRLMGYWVVWAVTYLGLTWFLIARSSASRTRRWVLAERIPPRPHISVLRSVVLRIWRVLFLASRTSSLFFKKSPKQRDFAYFAFTVGTSFTVSDVNVTDDAMRQAVLGHQILSFFYNTSILATVVTMATG